MYDYTMALMTGVDIAVPELQLTLHQPSIKEISMIGEQEFFIGIQVLTVKKNLYIQDEAILAQTSNFQIFMTMINEKQMADKKSAVLQVLSLIIPKFKVVFTPRSMILNSPEVNITIDEDNFEFLQNVLIAQFCLSGSGQENFNPKSKKAQEIAQKLMKARQKVAAQKAVENGSDKSMFNQYLSILTVGLNSMSLFDLMELTMYQLYDLIERYMLYINWDIDIRSRMAGAKNDKPVENWMKQIH